MLGHLIMLPIISLVLLPKSLAHQIAKTKYPEQHKKHDVHNGPGKNGKERERLSPDDGIDECAKKLQCTHRNAPPQKTAQNKPRVSFGSDALPILSLRCSHARGGLTCSSLSAMPLQASRTSTRSVQAHGG